MTEDKDTWSWEYMVGIACECQHLDRDRLDSRHLHFFPPSPYILVFDPPFYVLVSPHHMNCRDATIVACKSHCLMYMSYMYHTSSIMHHISHISHHAHHTQNVHGMCHICIYLQLYIAYVHLFTLWQPNMAIEHVVWYRLYKWGLTIQSDSPPKKEHTKKPVNYKSNP